MGPGLVSLLFQTTHFKTGNMKNPECIKKGYLLLGMVSLLLWPARSVGQPWITDPPININRNAPAARTPFQECEPINSFPYSESFTQPPPCWTNRDNLSGGRIWQFGTFEHGLAGSDGHYAYFDCWSNPGSCDGELISPVMNLVGVESARVRFTHTYRHSCPSMGRLMLSTDGGNTWVVLRQWTSLSSFNPDYVDMKIDQAAGASAVLLKWHFVSDGCYYWSIDDVVVSAQPLPDGFPVVQTLMPEQRRAGTSLQARLVAPGQSPVRASGFLVGKQPLLELGLEQLLDFPSGPLAAEGLFSARSALESSTHYYVRAYAQNDHGLSYGAVVSFYTPAGFRLPFLQAFETTSLPDYWQVKNNLSPVYYQWEFVPVTEDDYAGLSGHAARIKYDWDCDQNQDAELISPVMQLQAADYTQISFSHRYYGCYDSRAAFSYSLDGGQNWIEAEVWQREGNYGEPFSLILENMQGDEKLQLKWHYQSRERCSWTVDNVQVKPINMFELQIAVQGEGTVYPHEGTYLHKEGDRIVISAGGPVAQVAFREWIITDYPRIIYPKVRVVMEKDMLVIAVFDPVAPLTNHNDSPGEVQVYPNPATGRVFVDLPATAGRASVEVISRQGRLLYSVRLHEVQDAPVEIPLEGIPRGLNMLRVTSDQGVVLRKVMVL